MSIIGDIIEEQYEPVLKKVKELEALLEVEKAFHQVAIRERDYERHRYDSVQPMLVKAEMDLHDAQAKLDDLRGQVEILEHEVETFRVYSHDLEEKVLAAEAKVRV